MIRLKRPVILASGVGCLSLFLAWGFLQFKVSRLNALTEPVIVLVAAKDIAEGTPLEEVELKESSVPRRFVQPGALVSLNEFAEAVTAVPILQGEQILETKLTHLLNKTGLSVRLPEGTRAVSLSLDEPALEAGLIRPHNFVDVLATFEMRDEMGETQVTTQILIQRAEVLAVGEDIGGIKPWRGEPFKKVPSSEYGVEGTETRAVTLALNPKQAQLLSFALDQGRIKLVLRPQWEEDLTPVSLITAAEIVGFRGSPQRSRYREYRGK